MEQKTKLTEAAQRAMQITALRTESADTVRHGWLALTGMNVLTVLIPLLIPVICTVYAFAVKLPVKTETLLVGVVSVLACIALQSFFAKGLADSLLKMAAGKDVRFNAVNEHMNDAGRVLLLFLMGLILLCAAMTPGAAVACVGMGLDGAWRIVIVSLGCAAALALLLVVMLCCCLSLFVMASDEKCGAAAALMRSARLMKGHKRQLVMALLPSLLLLIGLTAAMALLLWPLAVKRDILTDTLMIAGGIAYVISVAYISLRLQAMLACLYNTVSKE